MLIGALLFAQAAFATQPCVEPGMSITGAIVAHPCAESGMPSSMTQQSDYPCHQPALSKATLCVAKCADSDKLSGFAQVTVSPAPDVVVLMLPVADRDRRLPDRHLVSLASTPPKSILFCSFLI